MTTATHQNKKTAQQITVVGTNTNSKGEGILYRNFVDGAEKGATQRTNPAAFAKKFRAL